MCLGMNDDVLEPGQRCASTSNRNFEGRQGRGGRTHLVSPAMAAAAAIRGHFTDVRGWDVPLMDAAVPHAHRPRRAAGPARRRHRPDHPEAVPEAARPHRLRRRAVLRLAGRRPAASRAPTSCSTSRASPAPRSCWPAPTSAAARRANTRCGRCATSASAWCWRRSFADIFASNALANGFLAARIDEATLEALAARPRAAGLPAHGRPRDQPAARRRRLQRADRRRSARRGTRLLDGLDDIGLILQHDAAIRRYEATHQRRRARLSAAASAGARRRPGCGSATAAGRRPRRCARRAAR